MLSIRYMKTDLSRRIVFWTGHDMKIIRAIGCTLLVNKILHLYTGCPKKTLFSGFLAIISLWKGLEIKVGGV